jgi:hypothetical protein
MTRKIYLLAFFLFPIINLSAQNVGNGQQTNVVELLQKKVLTPVVGLNMNGTTCLVNSVEFFQDKNLLVFCIKRGGGDSGGQPEFLTTVYEDKYYLDPAKIIDIKLVSEGSPVGYVTIFISDNSCKVTSVANTHGDEGGDNKPYIVSSQGVVDNLYIPFYSKDLANFERFKKIIFQLREICLASTK